MSLWACDKCGALTSFNFGVCSQCGGQAKLYNPFPLNPPQQFVTTESAPAQNWQHTAFLLHLEQVEGALLVKLEELTREMFEFTGWEDDVDDEPSAAVLKVRSMLNDIENVRKLRLKADSAQIGNEEPHG